MNKTILLFVVFCIAAALNTYIATFHFQEWRLTRKRSKEDLQYAICSGLFAAAFLVGAILSIG